MQTSILYSKQEVVKKINQLATKINGQYSEKDTVLVVGILKGAFYFYVHLVRQLKCQVICDFCSISFYGDEIKANQEAYLTLDIMQPIYNRHVLLVDCIADGGDTLTFIQNHIKRRNPKSLKTVVLIEKPKALKHVKIDFYGFQVKQDTFVVGCGIDYKQQGRCLPYLCQVNNIN